MDIHPFEQPATPASWRQHCAAGAWSGPTAGLAPGFVQGNVVILPVFYADAFETFCRANAQACPLLAVSQPGQTALPMLGAGIDISRGLPRYRVFRDGVCIAEPAAVAELWRDDLVTFVIGCSFAIFAPGLLSLTLRGALLAIGAQGGYYAITTWLPTFLRTERHLTILGSNGYLGVIIFGSLCGYIASAILTDVIGRRPNFLLFAVGSAVIVLLYTQVPVSNHVMLALGFPLGFFASGIFSGMGAFYTELFPTAVRATAQGFCYNSGRGLAAFFPALVGYVTKSLTLGVAIGLFAACAYGLVIIAALLLPETKGRTLEEIPVTVS